MNKKTFETLEFDKIRETLKTYAVMDITKSFQTIGQRTLEVIVPYLMLAVGYLVIIMIVTGLVKRLERRLRASDRN